MEWFAAECGGLLHQCDSGEPQAQIDSESLWGQSGRADCARQAFFLLRQRVGPDCPAHCHAYDCSQRGIPTIRAAATSFGNDPSRTSTPKQHSPFYQQMFSLYENTGGTPTGCPWMTPLGSPPRNGCANRQSVSHSSDDHEQVQTVRFDYNINPKDTTWFRFQADTGVQAAYTIPSTPLFDAFSPQPLYSFAAGHTHVFSQNLVNYFNPAFSWYESLFGPSNFHKTLSAFPIVLQGTGANAFTPIGGLDNTWIQGRRASRFFINDNLAWSRGAHELRFGTNTRIFRLNDYDFGEGTVPTATYATCSNLSKEWRTPHRRHSPRMQMSPSIFSISISTRKTPGK